MTERHQEPEIIAFLETFFGMAGLDTETDLFQRGLDSMQVLELVTFLEQKYKIQVPPDRVTTETMATPRRIAGMVRMLQAA
jgi:acyl carrier protein